MGDQQLRISRRASQRRPEAAVGRPVIACAKLGASQQLQRIEFCGNFAKKLTTQLHAFGQTSLLEEHLGLLQALAVGAIHSGGSRREGQR
jgi:hypothetical protein